MCRGLTGNGKIVLSGKGFTLSFSFVENAFERHLDRMRLVCCKMCGILRLSCSTYVTSVCGPARIIIRLRYLRGLPATSIFPSLRSEIATLLTSD